MRRGVNIRAGIEIRAPPAAVRSVFLDFAGYNKWHPSWAIAPHDDDRKPLDLRTGDKLKVEMHKWVHNPSVVANDDDSFSWTASLPGLLTGIHHFRFIPSKETPGHTTFVQEEDFWGWSVSLFSFWWGDKELKPSDSWKNFNEDLKKEVERIYPAQS